VLVVDEEVYEGECPREIHGGRMEDSREEEEAVLKEFNVGRRESNLLHPTSIQTSKADLPDSRSLKETELSALIDTRDNMIGSQKVCLIDLLSGYMKCFTARPGRCKIFEYRFEANEDKPIVDYSRPIPFAVHPADRNQIRQTLQDDILEIINLPFLNPLSVVYEEGEKIRICVDARKSNQYMVPNRERTHPYNSY
jgi:hypothetical protein